MIGGLVWWVWSLASREVGFFYIQAFSREKPIDTATQLRNPPMEPTNGVQSRFWGGVAA